MALPLGKMVDEGSSVCRVLPPLTRSSASMHPPTSHRAESDRSWRFSRMRTWTSSAAAIVAIALIANIQTSGQTPPSAAASSAVSEGIDPALLKGLSWRSIGPARGGRSQAVAGSTSRPLEYYFGATGGGLWKTTDGGVTWRAVSDKFFTSSSVGAVGVSESNPDVVYVGMGETELRGNILQGDGVYKSVDGGKTF